MTGDFFSGLGRFSCHIFGYNGQAQSTASQRSRGTRTPSVALRLPPRAVHRDGSVIERQPTNYPLLNEFIHVNILI